MLREEKPRRRTRLTCWIVPMVRTSFRNCFSPKHSRPSSLFTAMAALLLRPGSVPLYTDPKLPPPIFSEKFLVALLTSLYFNATI